MKPSIEYDSHQPSPLSGGRVLAKRAFDLAISVPALFVLSPVLLLSILGTALTIGRPCLFFQLRPGLNGRLFPLVKIRTMSDLKAADGTLLPDELRLGRFGSLLRRSSIDEVPQLLNVIAGQMSLVGPRPLLPEYLPRYSQRQARRHLVRPGITGWAQVNGRNAVAWNDRLEMDSWYVENWSFFLDLRIVFLTIVKVFRRDGIVPDNLSSQPKFLGNEPE